MVPDRSQSRSPLIRHISWGRLTIEGVGSRKDFKLWPGGGRLWDWTETGTHHVPGIQPADVAELVEAKGVEAVAAETTEAARLYNRLAVARRAVGGLFHSTC